MLASYLLDAPRARRTCSRTSHSSTPGYKALREEDVCGRGAKAVSFADIPVASALDFARRAPTWPCSCRGRCALLRSASARNAVRDARDAADPRARRDRAGRHPRRRRGARAQSLTSNGSSPRSAGGSSSWRAASSTSTRPKQLGEVLFEKLQLPALKRNPKTRRRPPPWRCSRSWRSARLPRLILEWRGLQKLKGTYIDALPQLVHPDTGRVHTCFNQAVAATGRLSSSDPNLQNIPIRTELGREIRRAFIADPGHVLISADYSQIELRVLAHLSGDEALVAPSSAARTSTTARR
jgi:DNA polymerase I